MGWAGILDSMAKSEYSFESLDGSKYWYKNSRLHREDGPAVEWATGCKSWYVNGQLHREDGPALERIPGYMPGKKILEENEYWLFDVKIPKEMFTPEYILEVKLVRIIET